MSASLISTLESLRDESGALTPRLVVEAARPVDSLLHHHFEWDDTVAADQYRIQQAGQLLRVTFRPDPSQPTHLRAFVAIKGEDTPQSSYVPTEQALADPLMSAIVLRSMNREWKAFKKRYEHMAEFAALIQGDLRDEAS